MNRSILFGIVAGVSALAFSSCAYDPYYAGGGGGYGDGYGYGSSGFSTSYFVSTGSPRWAYDPYAGAYFDYTRHCYYDPYLDGYYPRGYRPRYVTGAPHPHGWSRGSDYCPPPSRVRSYTLTNYRDRGERYRSLGRSWSSNVRVNNQDNRSGYGDRDDRSRYSDRDNRSRYGDRDNRSSYGDRSGSRSDWQRSSADPRSNRSGSIFGDRSSGGNRSGYTPQRGGSTQTYDRTRSGSDRSGAFGRSPSPGTYTRTTRDDSAREWSNRTARSAPQIQRQAPQIDRSAPRIERQAPPQIERRESRDSDRREKFKIKGLGEG